MKVSRRGLLLSLASYATLASVHLANAGFHGGGIGSATFGGDPNFITSAIDTSGGIAYSRNAGQLPAFVHVSAANINVTGNVMNSNTGLAVSPQPAARPYERLEYTWNFGDPGGTEIFTNPVTNTSVNANSAQTGPEAVYCYRTAGTKVITLTIRGLTAIGTISTTATMTFTASAFNTISAFTCNTNGTTSLTNVSPTNNLCLGCRLTNGTGNSDIPTGAYITAIAGTTVTISAAALGSHTGVNVNSNATLYYDSRNTPGPGDGSAANPYTALTSNGPINSSNRIATGNVQIFLANGASWSLSSSGFATIGTNVNTPIRVTAWENPNDPSSGNNQGNPDNPSNKPQLVNTLGAALVNQGLNPADVVFSDIYCEGQSTINTVGFGAAAISGVTIGSGLIAEGTVVPSTAVSCTFNGTTTVTAAGNNLLLGQGLKFSGSPPSPLVAGTVYYATPIVAGSTFSLSATSGGTAISIASGSGSATSYACVGAINYHVRGGADEFGGSSFPNYYDNVASGPGNGCTFSTTAASSGTTPPAFNLDNYTGSTINDGIICFMGPNGNGSGGIGVFQGSIAYNGGLGEWVLTVGGSGVDGVIVAGQRIIDLTGNLAYGTQIVANISGSGVGSTWSVTAQSGSISSELMMSSGPHPAPMVDLYFDNLTIVNSGSSNCWTCYFGGASIFVKKEDFTNLSLYGCTLTQGSAASVSIASFGSTIWNSMLGCSMSGRTTATSDLNHYINPEASFLHLLYRWLNVQPPAGFETSNYNFCLQPRADTYNNWTVEGDHDGGYILISENKFQYAASGIGLNNEHNFNSSTDNWTGTYGLGCVIQKNQMANVVTDFVTSACSSNLTIRDNTVWMCGGLFSPSDEAAGNIQAMNDLGSYLVYRNSLYRPPNPYTISNVAYNSTTGVVTLTLSTSVVFPAGVGVQVTLTGGSGSFAQLEGFFPTLTASGTTVTYQAPTSLTAAATGGTMGLLSSTWGFGQGELTSPAVLQLFYNNPSNTFQEVTNNIIWDDRTAAAIFATQFAEQETNTSVWDTNQYYAPQATDYISDAQEGANLTLATLLSTYSNAFEKHGSYAKPSWTSPWTGDL